MVRIFQPVVLVFLLLWGAATAHAGLFEDEEARKAILDLRQRLETTKQESAQTSARSSEEIGAVRRSLLDLQNQIELLRVEMAKLRGLNEQLSRDLSDTQQNQQTITQAVDERLRPLEPLKVSVDGREFIVEPAENREFEAIMAVFRKGDFPSAQTAFVGFLKRYPLSGYRPSALFWLGNAQYATRDYKEAMENFRTLIASEPDHMRAPEAVLSIANCQIELKDSRGARKTLEDLIKAYPQSEASLAAMDRLARLK